MKTQIHNSLLYQYVFVGFDNLGLFYIINLVRYVLIAIIGCYIYLLLFIVVVIIIIIMMLFVVVVHVII